MPPYEGNEPYLYLAFAEADTKAIRKLLIPLVTRGCRVWYCTGTAGSAETLLHRHERSAGAALTVLYMTDAVCTDTDTKSYVLVNQKFDRPILCLDPDGKDRRLTIGLRETVPHVPLYKCKPSEEQELAILHGEGFSQQLLGPSMVVKDRGIVSRLSAVLCTLALLRELNLAGSTVDDLGDLTNLPSLEIIHLEHTGVRNLISLNAFPNLKTVTVSRDMLPLTWNKNAGYAVVLVS